MCMTFRAGSDLKSFSQAMLSDDTVLSYSSDSIDDVIEALEEEAHKVLRFFASNGLVANPSKTKFLLLRSKANKSWPVCSVKIGEHIINESKAEKILGVIVNNRLNWSDHFEHLDSTLRQRAGIIKRLGFKIPRKAVIKLLDGIMYSHVRYCLPVFSLPRLSNDQPVNGHMKALQVTLNNGLRNALGIRKSSKVSVVDLHEKCKATTLNHLSIQTTLKLVLSIMEEKCDGLNAFFESDKIQHEQFTRSQANEKMKLTRKMECFRHFAAKIWNCYKGGPNAVTKKEFMEKIPPL